MDTAQDQEPKKRRLVPFIIGLLLGLGANGIALVIGNVSCGSEPGEIPPFLVFLMIFWLIQWTYLVPAMIVVAIMRRWWVLLGLFIAGVLTGLASLVLVVLMASQPMTV